MSLIALLGGTAAVLFAFGRFNFLGWMGKKEHVHPQMLPCGVTNASQRGTIKFFLTVALLLQAQQSRGIDLSLPRGSQLILWFGSITFPAE